MKIIEKLPPINELNDSPLEVGLRTNKKINDIIEAVNALLITHPNLDERIKNRDTFDREFKGE